MIWMRWRSTFTKLMASVSRVTLWFSIPKQVRGTRLDKIADSTEEFVVQGVDENLNTKFANVSHWVCNGKKEVLEVKLKNGSKVRLTPDHRVLTENGWREIGDLQIGDMIATPRKLEVIEGKEYDKTALKVLAEQQIIPEFVFSLKEELIAFFVGELWENCGVVDASKTTFIADSEQFAFDLQTLLLRLGIASMVEKTGEDYQIIITNFNPLQKDSARNQIFLEQKQATILTTPMGVEHLRSSKSSNNNSARNIEVLADLRGNEPVQLATNRNVVCHF